MRRNKILGFVIFELIIALGILGLTVMSIGAFTTSVFKYNRMLGGQLDAEIQVRRLASQFSTELRTASSSSLGVYPLEQATAGSVIFYANIDADSSKERERYFLNGTTLQKGTLKPSGSPLTYNPLNEKVVSLVDGVRNTDILSYYDDTYNGASPPLSFPVSPGAVRLVGLKLEVDQNVNEPPGAIKLETNVKLRNL